MKQLWYGGKIYTMEKENETVEAVLVEDGKIVAIGAATVLESQADEKYDLNGATMYPGFVDSHLHIISHGEKISRLDLSTAASLEEMLELLREAAKHTPSDQWLFGEGWNENNFSDSKIPTLEQLDNITNKPMMLTRICHHQVLVNSKALEIAGITEATEDPDGGKIGRNVDGTLNGRLIERAKDLVEAAIPKEGEAYIDYLSKTLNLAIDDLLSKGLTGGHSEDMSYFGHYMNPLTAYKRVIGEKHHFRVNLLRHNFVFEQMMKDNISYDEPFIEPGGMKLFADGALGGSTAALSKPYADDPNNSGMLIQSNEELESYLKMAREYHESVAIHAIGDAGAEQVIQALEKYPVQEGKRDRLIHGCILREDLVERLKKLSIVIDIQPLFVPSDFPWVQARLGKERLEWAYAWRKLLDRGIMCANGTDSPIEDVDPIKTIYAAVERKRPNDDHEGYLPDEKLSRFEAVQLYTLGSANAICKEHERGLIKVGYDADFSIFDKDLFEGTSEDMLQAKAIKTVVAGKIVYENNR
ncbi:amidohydrolase [Ureibacillus massiliensis 4400831 = CIP 108448 = CCUG 49529]|uniref:Amidohydrolase n=1 Tax=Ureibacillus massiliensis 4400831 = CIP 108448 = CCUG 49529 TaxID=1211035 RepID=A0A0A3J327_9BACL|nr:amidohydrolase [Ureibacillus massiliensis]KGR90120.1 amidohydrolase [Ureibacillus massiliensis 4400831 = CIP 108448 = CCUG 49529]